MAPTFPVRSPDTPDPLPQGDASVLLAQARALQRAALAGQTQPLLRGKNLGLLCATDDKAADAALFRHAATVLGAHVAQIPASLSHTSTPQEVQHTARMLGRLYDAVECQGMPGALVQQVAQAVDMPVFEGLASLAHPAAALAEQLDLASSASDRRMFVVQAVLLGTLA
jgi:ornithine carbamoyltransferase